MEKTVYRQLQQLRQITPLIQNITNFVVMNNTANALLALGASPIMVHAQEEIEEVLPLADALVINIGTLSGTWVKSMLQAVTLAKEQGKPWVLDPVGAGISSLRNTTLQRLLSYSPTVIRGNASEILALHDFNLSGGKGVDSVAESYAALNAATELHHRYGSIVCISGETDYVVSGNRITEIANGDPLMQKVTGLGCTASALIAAFLALGERPFDEAIAGMAVTSLAGELAMEKSEGPGTLQLHLLDCLYQLNQESLNNRLNLKSYGTTS